MTQNIFNQDIGDLGSAATTVAPVQDRSVLMQEQATVQQAQDTANDVATLAKGIFDIAPVVKEAAANRYVEKNLVGTTEQTATQQSQQEQAQGQLMAEVDTQKKISTQDINTLRGLEQARAQGLSYDEMQIRAEEIRREAIDRAPIFKDEINAAFRSVTGTSTGTGSLTAAASPWTMTPEEQAMVTERKEVAALALELNVDLPRADKLRADIKWAQIQTDLAPKTDSEFALWTQGHLAQGAVKMDTALLALADANGTFPTEVQPQMISAINDWENQALLQVQTQLVAMQQEGVLPSKGTIDSARAQISEQGDRLRKLISDKDSAAYVKAIRDTQAAQVDTWVYNNLPAVSVAKQAGIDLVDFQERLVTNPRFEQAVLNDPTLSKVQGLLGMKNSEFNFVRMSEATQALVGEGMGNSGVLSDEQVSKTVADMLNAGADGAEQVYALAQEAGNYEVVQTAITRNPGAVVHLKQRDLMANPPTAEQTDSVFGAAAEGIDGRLYRSGKGKGYSVYVGNDGRVRMDGTGVDKVARGQLQDLYDTVVANPDVWKSAGSESAEMYLQEKFPNRVFTVTGKVSDKVNVLKTATTPQELTKSVLDNLPTITTTIEDVEAVTRMLDDQMQAASTIPFPEGLKVRNDIISAQNKLWQQWESVANEQINK